METFIIMSDYVHVTKIQNVTVFTLKSICFTISSAQICAAVCIVSGGT